MQLHCHSFLLLLIKLIDFSYKTAFPTFYCIISPHQSQLGTNRAVETFRSRCRACRRHRCRRYGVREDIIRRDVVLRQYNITKKHWAYWFLKENAIMHQCFLSKTRFPMPD